MAQAVSINAAAIRYAGFLFIVFAPPQAVRPAGALSPGPENCVCCVCVVCVGQGDIMLS